MTNSRIGKPTISGSKSSYPPILVTHNDIKDAFRDRLELVLGHAFDISFPQHVDNIHPASKTWIHNPASKSLARAMAYVYGNGTNWIDVKADNLGIRPRTGDIVMFDLGLFTPRE